MTAQSIAPPRLRYLALGLAACLIFVGLSVASTSAQAAQTTSFNALNLCIKRSGDGQGTVRLISAKARCNKSERGVLFLTTSGKQGVLGVEAESGAAGPTGATGPVGPTGATGPEGPAGPQGEKGPVGEKGPIGEKGPTGDKGPIGDKGPRASRDRWARKDFKATRVRRALPGSKAQ
jgi:Collagen triple helix repeat (20 copies)